MTYNQSQYITEALDGFCVQETSFPFVCCIVDDASTEGEQDVILRYFYDNFDVSEEIDCCRETDYARIYFAGHKVNRNCHFAVLLLKENHYQNGLAARKYQYLKQWSDNSDYQAICEGDDFWTDSLKLQKQADHLDADPECMLCCTDVTIDSPSQSYLDIAGYGEDCIVPPSDMIEKGGAWIASCSCVFRPAVFDKFVELECTRLCHIGDWCMQILSVLLGNAFFINEKMSCYRYVSNGSWTQKISDIDPRLRLPEIKSIVDMLLGLDEFSGKRFHTSFANALRKYVHDKALLFCRDKASLRIFKKTCSDAWRYLSVKQRILMNVYHIRFVERGLVELKKHLHLK